MSYWWNIGIVIVLCTTAAVAFEKDFYSPQETENYDGLTDQLDWINLRFPEEYEEQRELDQEFERRRPLFYPIMPYHPFYPHYYPSQDSDEFETIEAVRNNNYNDQFASEESEDNNNYDQFTGEERSKGYFHHENSKLHPSLNIGNFGNKDQDKHFFFSQTKPHFPSKTPNFEAIGSSKYSYHNPYYLLHGNFGKKKPMGLFHQKYPFQRFPYNINKFNDGIKNKPSFYGYQKPQTLLHGNMEKAPTGSFQHNYFKPHFPFNTEKYGKEFFVGPVNHGHNEPHLTFNQDNSEKSNKMNFHYRPFYYRPHFPYFTPFHKKTTFNNYQNDIEDVQESEYGQMNTEAYGYFSEKGNNGMFDSIFNKDANEMKPKDILSLFMEFLKYGCHHQGHNKPHGDESSQEHLEDEVEGSGEEIIPSKVSPAHIPEVKDI